MKINYLVQSAWVQTWLFADYDFSEEIPSTVCWTLMIFYLEIHSDEGTEGWRVRNGEIPQNF